MPDWLVSALPTAIVVAVIGVLGTVIVGAMTRQTSKETNEISVTANEIEEAANKAAEADSLIKNLSAEVKRQDDRLDRMDERLQRQDETIAKQGSQIIQLQANERGLRWYVHKLIDKIRSLGHEPPPPPHDLNL